jgi:hypothetical protein
MFVQVDCLRSESQMVPLSLVVVNWLRIGTKEQTIRESMKSLKRREIID